jgi:hypothetical protein
LEDKRSAGFENCKLRRTTKVHIFLANGKFFYPIIVENLAPLCAGEEQMFCQVACVLLSKVGLWFAGKMFYNSRRM